MLTRSLSARDATWVRGIVRLIPVAFALGCSGPRLTIYWFQDRGSIGGIVLNQSSETFSNLEMADMAVANGNPRVDAAPSKAKWGKPMPIGPVNDFDRVVLPGSSTDAVTLGPSQMVAFSVETDQFHAWPPVVHVTADGKTDVGYDSRPFPKR